MRADGSATSHLPHHALRAQAAYPCKGAGGALLLTKAILFPVWILTRAAGLRGPVPSELMGTDSFYSLGVF